MTPLPVSADASRGLSSTRFRWVQAGPRSPAIGDLNAEAGIWRLAFGGWYLVVGMSRAHPSNGIGEGSQVFQPAMRKMWSFDNE